MNPKLCASPDSGPCTEEEFLVEGVAIVLPEVINQPSICHAVVAAPSGHTAKDVRLCEDRPTLVGLSVDFVELARCTLPTFALRIVDDVVEERQMAVRKVRRLRGPIVHLHIDVVVHVRVPRRIVAVVPNALQVVGQRHCTAARRDAEVSTKVEVELFEEQAIGCVAVVGRCAIIVHQVFGVALRSRAFEMERHATHIRLVVGNVGSFDSFKRFLRSIVHESGDARVEVFGSTFGACGEDGVE